ncbi:hypothetical protein [Actinoplanes regularis]|uniref:hypothetical protein n=1 Tax=Actinoplanes regularis TaxID=52697 RepID=UPI0024A51D57|nr:hypothetical protein [Actinoplanes regularis]GLW35220.1 hypothetical protein Areg01_81560 [Actinoplanes regularis]
MTEESTALLRRNRKITADRRGWPVGALELCERLDAEHPGWSVWWRDEWTVPGWEHPAGWAVHRPGWSLVGGDETRRAPEDGVRRMPTVFDPTVDGLQERIAMVEARHAAEAER